jgi:hypothetical protein
MQIQGAAEALNNHDGPDPAVRQALAPRTQKPRDGTYVHTHHCATQIVIPDKAAPSVATPHTQQGRTLIRIAMPASARSAMRGAPV